MEIRVLGPLEVWTASEPVSLGGPRQRAVLAMLALSANRVVSVSALVDGLWGDRATAGAANAVQVYMSRFRKIFSGTASNGAVAVRRQSPGYLLEIPAESLDLLRFEHLIAAGSRELNHAPRVASAILREALDLWRGGALAEFTAMPFAASAGTRLRELQLTALVERIEADLALGRHSELLAELEVLADLHPLHEQLHGQLVRSLYRAGRQGDALQALRRIRATLAAELGVDPGRGLADLEEAVLQHAPSLEWEPVPPAEPVRVTGVSGAVGDDRPVRTEPAMARPAVWNVPPRNPHFSGRTSMLAGIADRLGQGEKTLVVQALYGLGGVGKTQIAIEFAHRYSGGYQMVWWIDAEQPLLIPEQMARLSGLLQLPPRASVPQRVQQVIDALSARDDWLLIFDNAERIEDVAPYRPAGAGHILVTSRSPGWGELGGRIPVDVLDRRDTLHFLQSRLPGIEPAVADELAAELGDLPLAVAQAIAYIEQSDVAPVDYLDQFSTRRSALLARGKVLGYQSRVNTAWSLSLERLQTESPSALNLLQHASFLAPEPIRTGWFEAAAAALTVPGQDQDADGLLVSDAVAAAAALSLVRRSPGTFQMHRLVQAVIRDSLSAARQVEIAAAVADLMAAAHPGDSGDPANWPGYAALVPHVFVIGAALDTSAPARRLVLDTVAYLNLAADARASRRLGTEVLKRWRTVLGRDHRDTLTLAAYLMMALIWAGDAESARALGLDSLPRARQGLGVDDPETLRLATYLTFAQAWVADSTAARVLALDTLERAKRILPVNHPDLLRLGTYLSLALAWAGEREASAVAVEFFDGARSTLGPNHPTTLFAAVDVMFGMLTTGDVEGIRVIGDDVLGRAAASLGASHLITLGAAAVFTQALVWTGEVPRAVEFHERFLAHTAQHLGPNHLITLTAAASWASIRAVTAEPDEVPDRQAVERAREFLGSDHPITLITAAAVATSLSAGLDDGGAEGAFLAAETREKAERTLGADHVLTRGLRER